MRLKTVDSPLTAYIALVSVSGVLNLLVGFYVYVKRHLYANIAAIFILGTAAEMIYCFAYAFSLTSSTLEELRFWSVMQYFGMPFAPPLGLLFALHYLGYRITKGRVAALMAFPVLSLLSNATNDLHHLHYKSYQIHETLGAPYYDIEVGVTYIINGSFMFVCMLGGSLLLLARWKDTDPAYRPQLASLICAMLLPMTVSFLYLIGVTPTGIDPVPMVVGVSSVLMWWAIVSSRLLTIVPIAKDTIFHSISDGVIVLDKPGRLVEFNDGCRRMFHRLDRSMFGQPLHAVWPQLFGAAAPPAPELGAGPQELEVAAHEPEERVYRVRVSPLKRTAQSSWAGTVMIITDISELKRLQRKLERRAYYDELTQVFNRRAFFERCEEGYARLKRDGSPFTVILFDVDHFKKVNDTYGHIAGDQVLIHVARICKSCLTDDMLFARYGGEEFVLALFGRTASEGQEFAERLRTRIASQRLEVDGTLIKVTSSFGVAEASGRAEESLQQILRRADEALYEAKRGGRNQVRIYAEQSV
jgi:diguanylate cyclase (GGDEF)-like protein